jgi:hypothetical protein
MAELLKKSLGEVGIELWLESLSFQHDPWQRKKFM